MSASPDEFLEVDQWPTPKKLYVAHHLAAYHEHQEELADQADTTHTPGDVGDIQADLDAVGGDSADLPSTPTPSQPAATRGPAVDGKRITKAENPVLSDDAEPDDDGLRPARVRDRSDLTDVHPALRKYPNIVRVKGDGADGD